MTSARPQSMFDPEMLRLSPEEVQSMMEEAIRDTLAKAPHPKSEALSEELLSYLPVRVQERVRNAAHRRALRKAKRLMHVLL